MVSINDKLRYTDHLAEKVNKANELIGLIRKTFVAPDAELFKALSYALGRQLAEYANQVWSPHLVKDFEMLEKCRKGLLG